MIDDGKMVGDLIEKDLVERVLVFLKQEELIEQFTKD
jgi:hypothetical protein